MSKCAIPCGSAKPGQKRSHQEVSTSNHVLIQIYCNSNNYIHTYTNTYTHTYIHTYMHTYIHTDIIEINRRVSLVSCIATTKNKDSQTRSNAKTKRAWTKHGSFMTNWIRGRIWCCIEKASRHYPVSCGICLAFSNMFHFTPIYFTSDKKLWAAIQSALHTLWGKGANTSVYKYIYICMHMSPPLTSSCPYMHI